jgi:hypothetical protein
MGLFMLCKFFRSREVLAAFVAGKAMFGSIMLIQRHTESEVDIAIRTFEMVCNKVMLL